MRELRLDTYVQSTCLISGPAGWTTEAGCSTAAPRTEGEQITGLAFMLSLLLRHIKCFLTATQVFPSTAELFSN